MPIDLSEHLLTLPEASREIPKRPHTATLYRWGTRGCGGRRLEIIKIGSTVYTSREALARFAQPIGSDAQPIRTPARREREVVAAEKELAGMGI